MRKQQTYLPLLEALSYYSDQGWTIHGFPWVVGIRGTIDPTHIQSLLKFLGIQRKHWQVAVEKTVLASVRAFYFLHTVRFGGLQDDARPPHDPDHSDDDSVDVMGRVQVKRSLHRTTSRLSLLEDSDSDSPASPEAMQGPPKRRCPPVDRIVPTVIAAASPPPSDLSVGSDSPLPLPLHAPDAVRDRRHVGVARKNYFKIPRPARIAVKSKWHPLDVHILQYHLHGNDQSGGAKIILLSRTILILMARNSVPQSGLSGQTRMIRWKCCGLAGANWSPNGAGGPDAAGATRHHQSTTKHNFPEREH